MLHMLARHGGIVIIHMEHLIQELFVHLYAAIPFQLKSPELVKNKSTG
jgi:hypothetical protein